MIGPPEHDCSDYLGWGPASFCTECGRDPFAVPPRIFVTDHETKGPKRRRRAASFKEAKAPSKHARAQETEIINYTRDRNMKIIAVRYERVSNLGNYETERIAVESAVDPTETPQTVLAGLKAFVNDQLGIEMMSEAEIAEAERKLDRAKRRRGL